MSMSEVGLPGQRVDILTGGDVTPDGRLLSVAEIQQEFRGLLARKAFARTGAASTPATAGQQLGGAAFHGGETAPPSTRRADPDAAPATPLPVTALGAELGNRWIAVVAAHAGAGASTVALAIADAAAEHSSTNVIETAHPTRSGLVGAANAELGVDPTGAWRRGSRGQVTIDRRAGNDTPTGWPTLPETGDGVVVVDLGLPTPESLARLTASGCRVVVVCRPTVPGVRLAEQLLSSLTGPVILAAVGGGKWPGEVNASLGPRLRDLRANKGVVTVPADRRLEVTGPTNSPLPKPVAAAGRSLLGLIDAAHPGGATASAQSASRRGGTDR